MSERISVSYEINEEQDRRLQNAFKYHAPKNNQPDRYNRLRIQAYELAQTIAKNTPPSREQSLALTKLEEVIMWANAAIARNE
jgi:hypothetical protein